MTVKELIEELETCNPQCEVFINDVGRYFLISQLNDNDTFVSLSKL
jgi:hypothetical protein